MLCHHKCITQGFQKHTINKRLCENREHYMKEWCEDYVLVRKCALFRQCWCIRQGIQNCDVNVSSLHTSANP